MRRWAAGAVVVALVAGLGVGGSSSGAVEPSPLSGGCQVLNLVSQFQSAPAPKVGVGVTSVNPGEQITVTARDPGAVVPAGLFIEVPDGTVVATGPYPGPVTYTFTAATATAGSIVWGSTNGGTAFYDVTCGLPTSPPPSPASGYSVADLSITEGDGGVNTPKIAKFTVTRTGDLSAAGSVAVRTESGTSGNRAIQDKDFKKRDTILQFPAGVATARLEVKIIGDLIDEPTERFRVVIDKPVGGTVTDHLGIGTIVDDD